MIAPPRGPLADPSPAPSLMDLLRLAMEGLMPATPDLSAFLDRMEMPR
ncbi:hypothetical protein SAMN04488103_11285 [Gemmobacter aquatilis]|uniref:Uncharacterized protein n=1 Tax=Gemmobacter aquatilis TaxID=933059 RepID=A0A1H8M5S0_9RHOB|nr:hypothetical protein SAMN04488103_11285 [Gemmobacter aquatilis]